MTTFDPGDDLSRTVKLAIDSGEASTVEQAEALFSSYRLAIEIGPDVATSATHQAALLTAVNTGRRAFLGGVEVAGDVDVPLRVPWTKGRTLGEAVVDLQGKVVAAVRPSAPRIVIGDAWAQSDSGEFAIRATFDGWSGGVLPLTDARRLPEQQECTPAGVLAGALAVSEAFQWVRGSNAQAGRRSVGLSLWRPEREVDWLSAEAGPPLEYLPARLWLIGLGHLGQAYLWTLGLLPYAEPGDVQLVLQDVERLVRANDSTSLLTTLAQIGTHKTRAMAEWCKVRGFEARIVERYFAPGFTVHDDEPGVALCGIDKAPGRAALEDAGFQRVVEAGLGKGESEYLTFQLHTFPARRAARTIWGGTEPMAAHSSLVEQPAYQDLATKGLDACGLTTLAGRSVGASFVGAAAAALVVGEVLRMAMGAHRYAIMDGSLRSLSARRTVLLSGDAPFNPGVTQACSR